MLFLRMDLIRDYTPYRPGPGVQQTGPPLLPRFQGAAGVGPNLVTNYKKALYGGTWPGKDPVAWLTLYRKVWNYYGINTEQQIKNEFSRPSKYLTFAILAADTSSEDYMSRYLGLTGGDHPDDWRDNVHRFLIRGQRNNFAAALWDPRFDADVGYGIVPATDDPRFLEKLSGAYKPPATPFRYKSAMEGNVRDR